MLEYLQQLLLRTKLTQAEIAAGTKLSLSIIRGIKNGTKPNPTIETYQTLKEFLEAAEGLRSREAA